ncbi:MAG: hypothetical protein LQ347_000109 [Umbilicaria vellea]|nr:MAG: hypothetical protein LQ347_000109 [Umbilicaria vellea]
MAGGEATPDSKDQDLSDAETDNLFASPSRKEANATKPKREDLHTPGTSGKNSRSANNGDSRSDSEVDREATLRRELAGVRSINEVIEGVVESLERAKGNMEVKTPLLH